MRARYPDHEGVVDRDGVKVAFEVHGSGEPAVLFIPASPISHGRSWKGIVPSLARHMTVVVTDGRGTHGSDRPHQRDCYSPGEVDADLVSVLDAAGVTKAVVVAHCHASPWAMRLADEHAERVAGLVLIAPALAVAPGYDYASAAEQHWEDDMLDACGWSMRNRAFWRTDGGYRAWVEFFFDQQLPERHSTKQLDD